MSDDDGIEIRVTTLVALEPPPQTATIGMAEHGDECDCCECYWDNFDPRNPNRASGA